jgi:hypothetical protein
MYFQCLTTVIDDDDDDYYYYDVFPGVSMIVALDT